MVQNKSYVSLFVMEYHLLGFIFVEYTRNIVETFRHLLRQSC